MEAVDLEVSLNLPSGPSQSIKSSSGYHQSDPAARFNDPILLPFSSRTLLLLHPLFERLPFRALSLVAPLHFEAFRSSVALLTLHLCTFLFSFSLFYPPSSARVVGFGTSFLLIPCPVSSQPTSVVKRRSSRSLRSYPRRYLRYFIYRLLFSSP